MTAWRATLERRLPVAVALAELRSVPVARAVAWYSTVRLLPRARVPSRQVALGRLVGRLLAQLQARLERLDKDDVVGLGGAAVGDGNGEGQRLVEGRLGGAGLADDQLRPADARRHALAVLELHAAHLFTSPSPVGDSTSTISRQAHGSRVPRRHSKSGSAWSGFGVARTKRAWAGSGLRTATWWAAAREVFSTQMRYSTSWPAAALAGARTLRATAGVGGSTGQGVPGGGATATGDGAALGAAGGAARSRRPGAARALGR